MNDFTDFVNDHTIFTAPRRAQLGLICSAMMLFMCGCASLGGGAAKAIEPLNPGGKVKYYPMVMSGAWSLELAGIKTTFEFDRNGERNLWDVIGRSTPTGTRAICRNSFTLPEAGRVVMGMGCDWWMICRVDGKEVLNTFDYGNRVYPPAVDNYIFELDLEAGTHEVELEVKCGDLTFLTAFGNVPPADPTLLYEPILTDFAPGRMSITFVTVNGVPAAVDYRKQGTEQWTRVWHTISGQKASLERVHRVTLNGLESDTVYEYRLVTEHPHRAFREDHSAVRTFCSAPEKFRPFNVLLIGDTQGAWDDRARRVKAITGLPAFKNADILGHVGDYCDSTADIELALYPGLFDTFNGKPMIPVRGNHEYLGKESTLWCKYFGPSMKLMRYADVAFLMLDSGNGPWKPAPAPAVMNVPEPFWEEQRIWLEQAVASKEFKSARYKVLLAHGTPFGDASVEVPEPLRKLIDPVFGGQNPQAKLDLYIGGHVHVPMRTVPGKNQVYARQELRPQKLTGSSYHFPIVLLGGPLKNNPPELQLTSLELKFTEQGIQGIARDLNGDVLDDFTVQTNGTVKNNYLRSDFQLRDVQGQ